MAERPILFSAPMIRAILAGTKTQTRRVVKPVLSESQWVERRDDGFYRCADGEPTCYAGVWETHEYTQQARILCPYGMPGDRLWVRETFAHIYTGNCAPDARRPDDVAYRADGYGIDAYAFGRWCPSIHMPRWASRITLDITGVRVERLQAISEEDATAEGVEWLNHPPVCAGTHPATGWRGYMNNAPLYRDTARESFHSLWESINGGESWDTNPWVWSIEFERASPNGATKENEHV